MSSAHESLLRAIIAKMEPKARLGSAYGIFNTGYGIAWFLGSFFMGVLYEHSIFALVIFSIIVQLLALPILLMVVKLKTQEIFFYEVACLLITSLCKLPT